MHAVRRELVEAQAVVAGLPLWAVWLPWPCNNDTYEQRLGEALARARERDITGVAFGDLFLEDIRAYRERQLAGTGLKPLFPIWGTPTDTPHLAREILASGLRAVLTCVDPKQIDGRFAGRQLDADLLAELPPHADCCGEKGEFHTFCYAGPMFARPLEVHPGPVVCRDGFWFADLLAVQASPPAQGNFLTGFP